jgi:hypothetical protein
MFFPYTPPLFVLLPPFWRSGDYNNKLQILLNPDFAIGPYYNSQLLQTQAFA